MHYVVCASTHKFDCLKYLLFVIVVEKKCVRLAKKTIFHLPYVTASITDECALNAVDIYIHSQCAYNNV